MRIFRKNRNERKWDITLGSSNKAPFIELTDHGLSDEDFLPVYYEFIENLTASSERIVLSQMNEVNQLRSIDRDSLLNELKREYQVESFISDRNSLYLTDSKDTNAYIMHLYGTPDIEWIKRIIKFGTSSIPNVIYMYEKPDAKWINDIKAKELHFLQWSNRENESTTEAPLLEGLRMICFTSDGHLVVLINTINYMDIVFIINNIAKKYKYLLNIGISEYSS